jgi:hypothetical protein
MRAHKSTIITLAIAVPIAALVLALGALGAASQEPDLAEQPPLTAPAVATASGNTDNPPPEDVQLGECTTDQYLGPKATGTLTNHSSKLSNYMISANFTDSAGVIVAHATGLANNIPAGVTATWEALSFAFDVEFADCTIVKVERFSAQG